MDAYAKKKRISFIFGPNRYLMPPIRLYRFSFYTDHTHAAHKRQWGGGMPAKVSRKWREEEEALYRRSDVTLARSVGTEGRKTVEDEFTWEIVAKRIERSIRSVFSGRVVLEK